MSNVLRLQEVVVSIRRTRPTGSQAFWPKSPRPERDGLGRGFFIFPDIADKKKRPPQVSASVSEAHTRPCFGRPSVKHEAGRLEPSPLHR